MAPAVSSFALVALAPAGLADPAPAVAACRAGGVGMLDLEFVGAPDRARHAVEALARHAHTGTPGLRLAGAAPEVADAVLETLPEAIRIVVLSGAEPERTTALLDRLCAFDRPIDVWLEVTAVPQAEGADSLGVAGLVARGNETGGWGGAETTFVLLQRLLAHTRLPVWAHGGIGLHTAAACIAGGASGVVLDAQLALTRESPLPEVVRSAVARMDGSETRSVQPAAGLAFRVYARPGFAAAAALADLAPAADPDAWRAAVAARVGWGAPAEAVWPLGQDAAFAASLAARYRTVGGVFQAVREAVAGHIEAARRLRPVDVGSPLAASHGTRVPVVQGPMTRVSDTAAFAARVAEDGGLPFLALALMRGPEADALLAETRALLGDRPWGVGILGFVPLDLRREQLEVVRRYRPPFALIAGGRPDQARSLEEDGIATYLHVPSPGLLRLFLQDGARRFVFEGRECGGHVGPRSSFVLWNTMVDVLLEALPAGSAEDCHVLFAGGVHDARSAAMVAALAAPLAERGVRIGLLAGTAYLFTEEAVAAGAIRPEFQEMAVGCGETVLVESGPGHAVRCVANPFTAQFAEEKQRLIAAGKSPEEISHALDALGVGRLRVASKGLKRNPDPSATPDAPKLVEADPDEQRREGMYMIGQIAALHDRVGTIAELHDALSAGATRLLGAPSPSVRSAPEARPAEVAIVGMSCVLPKAPDLATFWANVVDGVYALDEIPDASWDWDLYFDADPDAKDKVYSRWGGYINPVLFDPVTFGMPPNTLSSIEPMQLLALVGARAAIEDAGYAGRPFDRRNTSVILGTSGGVATLGMNYALRAGLPQLFGPDTAEQVINRSDLPEWTEDSFAGLLFNVVAGRISNRLDFGGVNYTVDAACASSLTAVSLGVQELERGTSDMVLVGGLDTSQHAFGYLCFSKTKALSPSGRPRTFDASADGIAISEGLVMLVLKRLADAERDGDRIYAVIQGVAGSSDGKAKGLTAPRPEGQRLALERAYGQAGISPTTVDLFEAHGTGTVVGDRTEALSLTTFLEEAGAEPGRHAVGSVKTMIGHTKAAAGVAGLAKVALALHHRVLPPTLGVTTPNPSARFGEGPLYVNTQTRPWMRPIDGHPRRAGVSAFGFGGTNFHAVLEEYTGRYLAEPGVSARRPSELLLWTAPTRAALVEQIDRLEQALADGAQPALHDLAYTLAAAFTAAFADAHEPNAAVLAVVAESLGDLRGKLTNAREKLAHGDDLDDPRGIYAAAEPLHRTGRIAFLFPGQGSQYPGMLRDMACVFEEVRTGFEDADRTLADRLPDVLSRYVFPPPSFTPEEEQARQRALTETFVAQPALGAAETGMLTLLHALGLTPDMTAGHSYGEYVALHAAGVFDRETLIRISEARGRCIVEAAREDLGTMAAVSAGPDQVETILDGLDDIWIANLNAPKQTIISGTKDAVARAVERFEAGGIRARGIQVACAFHSPLVAPAQTRLAERLRVLDVAPPQVAVYANATAEPYAQDPDAVVALLGEHLVRPVRFADQIRAMYEAGARIFVEVGPRNVLSSLTRRVLDGRPHLAVATDQPHRHGLTQLHHALARLAAHGVPIRPDRLFTDRPVRRLDLDRLVEVTRPPEPSRTTWVIDGNHARPLHAPGGGERTFVALKPADAADPEPRSAAPTGESPASRGAAPGPTAANGGRPPDGAEAAMLQFQELMGRFLETQRQVMGAYLQGAPSATAGGALPSTAAAAHPNLAAPLQQVTPPATPEVTPQAATEAAPATAAATAPATAAATHTRASITATLLAIVSERTGYPADMLGLTVDMEAELGIDSIKRVEIVGAMQREVFPEGVQVDAGAVERLASRRTLGEVVDWIEHLLAAGDTLEASEAVASEAVASEAVAPEPVSELVREAPATPAVAPESADAAPAQPLIRQILRPVETPLGTSGDRAFDPNRVVVVTDDGAGLGEAVVRHVRGRGGKAVLVQAEGTARRTAPDRYTADYADPDVARALVALLRADYGAVGAIFHLAPAAEPGSDDTFDAWRVGLRREVKGLFFLIQAAADDLRQTETERIRVAAAVGLDGRWGADPALSVDGALAGRRGVAGVLKSVAQEWPGVRCKAVDLDPRAPVEARAAWFVAEIEADDASVEVGYRDDRRAVITAQDAPLDERSEAAPAVEPDDVWLVVGGARGITAEVAIDLAERYGPTLVLAGRSPFPVGEESSETAQLTTPNELKAALIRRFREAGEAVSVPRVEAACRTLLREREMRAAVDRMRRAGSRVAYMQADVRDAAQVQALVDRIRAEYGRLDGVLHGAGVIEDQRIESKTSASFDRVFDTKADGAFLLSRALAPESTRFFVLFSSAAGAFGNAGQADYAAANQVLDGLAADLGRRWPGRIVSVAWGPWAKTGMVTPELRRQFAARGVSLIEVGAGCAALDRELRYGRNDEPAVVLAGGTWDASGPHTGDGAWQAQRPAAVSRIEYPLMRDAEAPAARGAAVSVDRVFDPNRDRYLADHRIDGQPVLPFAVAVEWMAEAVADGWPDMVVSGLRDVKLLMGVVLKDAPVRLRLDARPLDAPPSDRVGADVAVRIRDAGDPNRMHYQATVELAARIVPPPPPPAPTPTLRPYPLSVEAVYARELFHGPLLQHIVRIDGIDEAGLEAVVRPSDPRRWVGAGAAARWVADPGILDTGMQLVTLWLLFHHDVFPLPTALRRLRWIGPIGASELRCRLKARATLGGRMVEADLWFVDPTGRTVATAEGVVSVGSAKLSRSEAPAERSR